VVGAPRAHRGSFFSAKEIGTDGGGPYLGSFFREIRDRAPDPRRRSTSAVEEIEPFLRATRKAMAMPKDRAARKTPAV